MILGKIKADAEVGLLCPASLSCDCMVVTQAFIGQPVSDAVITVPAYFNDAQRQAA